MSDTPQFLQREWLDFVEAVGLRNAPALQKREMRRAFFAGARAYSALLLDNLSAETDEATPEDEAFMEALEVEMEAFLLDVQEGRA